MHILINQTNSYYSLFFLFFRVELLIHVFFSLNHFSFLTILNKTIDGLYWYCFHRNSNNYPIKSSKISELNQFFLFNLIPKINPKTFYVIKVVHKFFSFIPFIKFVRYWKLRNIFVQFAVLMAKFLILCILIMNSIVCILFIHNFL